VAEYDVYGRMRVRVTPADDGWCRVEAVRLGGKLHALHDVVIPAEAATEDVIAALEAVFHEMGQPGSEIKRVR
jgi:hypothetical protein